MFHGVSLPSVRLAFRKVLHGCNTPVMSKGPLSLRVYPDRSPSKVRPRVHLADIKFGLRLEKFDYMRSSINV